MNDIYLITGIIIIFIAAMIYYIYYLYNREQEQDEVEETKKAIKNIEKTENEAKKEIEKTLIDDEKIKQSIKIVNIKINNIEQERVKKITQAKSNEEIKKIDNESKINIDKELSKIEESTNKLSIIEQKKQTATNILQKTEREKAIVIQNAKITAKHAEEKKEAWQKCTKKINKEININTKLLRNEKKDKVDKIVHNFKAAKKKIGRWDRKLMAKLHKDMNKSVKEISDFYNKKEKIMQGRILRKWHIIFEKKYRWVNEIKFTN